MNENMKLIYVDLFCGAGGTSTGVNGAKLNDEQSAKVVACVNHDKNAIASHAANHPDALHFTEDIRTLELTSLIEHLRKCRIKYPNAFVVLWASLECTNFSKAKGGQPRDADSRTLAEHLFRYIEAINPDYIQIENVEEFMSWGDMDENGKPISREKGKSYLRWVSNVKRYGYNFDHRILNSADYGAYTSRKRFFGIFAKKGLPIVWAEPTHCKDGKLDLFSSLEKWKPVKDVLDLSNEGASIFNRKKPLSPKTLERIYAGLIKFVAGGKDAFMLKYNSMNRNGKYQAPGIDEPCPTVSCQNRLAYANVQFLSKQFSGHPDSKNISVSEPAHAITTVDHHALVGVKYLTKYYSGKPENKCQSINEPAGTLRTKDCFSLIGTEFLSAYYGTGDNVSSIGSPCPTVTTKDRFNLVSPRFLDMQYGTGKPVSIDNPAGTVTTNPKHNLVTVKPWVMNTNFSNIGSSIDDPSQTITANRKWHYLMNPQFASAGGDVDKPCFTLIARMDKMPPYLVATESGGLSMQIYSPECEILRKIKEFMVVYGIVDIKMRMLLIPELKRIMGFPENYVLVGTQADQKKFIGNAVEVNIARALCERLCQKLEEMNIKPMAA